MEKPRLVAPCTQLERSYRTYVEELQANGEKLIPFPLALPSVGSGARVTCGRDNVGSARVIRANGGVFDSEEFVAEEGEVVQRCLVTTPIPE